MRELACGPEPQEAREQLAHALREAEATGMAPLAAEARALAQSVQAV